MTWRCSTIITALMSLLLSFTAVAACASTTSDKTTDMANASDTTSVKVEVTTTLGSFTVLLYGDTPPTAIISSSW